MAEITNEQIRKDTLKTLKDAAISLNKIVYPIMYVKCDRKEAQKFIEQGKFMRARAQILVIIECHNTLFN